MINTNKPLVESVKELARLVIFTVGGAVVSALINHFTEIPQTETTFIILFLLRTADRFVHTNDKIKFNGIIPF